MNFKVGYSHCFSHPLRGDLVEVFAKEVNMEVQKDLSSSHNGLFAEAYRFESS